MFILFFVWFPCVGVRLVYGSLRSTATFVSVSIGPCCWPFLSTFLPPLPFSDLSSHSPPILAVVFLVFCILVSDFFGKLSSFILTMCQAHFIRLLTILPTIQASFSSNFFSQVFRSPSLHSPYSGYSPYPVVLTYL